MAGRCATQCQSVRGPAGKGSAPSPDTAPVPAPSPLAADRSTTAVWHRAAARRHELAVLAASRPALPVLIALARFARPLRRVPRLGWVVGDPVLARRILGDGERFPLVGEGGVGHLWAQLLGDWVTELFDGPGHHALRARVRDLFTESRATALVRRAAGARLDQAAEELAAGRVVDLADLARLLVGRILADLLGLPGVGAPTTPHAASSRPVSGSPHSRSARRRRPTSTPPPSPPAVSSSRTP